MNVFNDPLNHKRLRGQLVPFILNEGDTLVVRSEQTLTSEKTEEVRAAYAVHVPTGVEVQVIPQPNLRTVETTSEFSLATLEVIKGEQSLALARAPTQTATLPPTLLPPFDLSKLVPVDPTDDK